MDTGERDSQEEPHPSLLGYPTLVRWYIDTRSLPHQTLPLLETLRRDDQDSVTKYMQWPDKHMSLASQLLKYYLIHRATHLPWNKVVIHRTPLPENRPCFHANLLGPLVKEVEFNVSHQASLTMLAGTIVYNNDDDSSHLHLSPASSHQPPPHPQPKPQIGIDVTCTNEPRRRNNTPQNLRDLSEFVDIFAEVFAATEVQAMKNPRLTLSKANSLNRGLTFDSSSEQSLAQYGLRLFYSFWALKEAFVKMTGDALLFPHLRELEFSDVIPPDPVPVSHSGHHISSTTKSSDYRWSQPYKSTRISLHGKPVTNVRIHLLAFEEDYIVATIGRGAHVGPIPASAETGNGTENEHPLLPKEEGVRIDPIEVSATRKIGDADPWHKGRVLEDSWLPVQEVDIERDIRSCAEGRCGHSGSVAL
ncbi:4'-phosphopantetheinyl transferase [Penicillium lagena]|uniref:4'-phosphopantetheinyl transferase n=1 Tax=Penicillium lagena TaxID=94218 RepID=UPI0025406C80|nr:4'-phosphopantetheinyl transferase [Penicillium lagena]KAJ5605594.1 4'-phosphopantetheinyl transferase [Penicillium lagena]